VIEGQTEKYANYMDEAMQELLSLLKDKSVEVEWRVNAARTMDRINDTLVHVEMADHLTDKAITAADRYSDKLSSQVRKLKPRQPWEEDEDE
jgi:hypothetical protein